MGTGKTYSTKYLLDSNNSSGVAGQVLSTTSTGIDWVDANTVPGTGLWLANGNNIYNSNSGNVGIGTTSPGEKLEVTGGKVKINKQDEALIINAISNNGSYILLTNTSTPYAYIGAANQIIIGGTATQLGLRSQSDMLFATNGSSERMRIDSSGKVGIGTTTPGTINGVAFSGVGLHVKAGTLGRTITEGTSFAEFIMNHSNASANQKIKFVLSQAGVLELGSMDDNGSRRTQVSILNNNNVGIGTTSPDSLLELENSPAAQTKSRLLHIDNNPINNQGSGYIEISSGSNNQAKTQIEQVSSGGFGLLGNQYIDTNIINRGLSSSAHGNINFATGSNTSATSIVMTIGGGSQKGNVGIGTTSPDSKLNINGNSGDPSATYTTTAANSTISIGDFSASGLRMMFGVNPSTPSTWIQNQYTTNQVTAKLLLNPLGGNVGIGTTNPARLLSVNGIQGWSASGTEKAAINPTSTGTDFTLVGDNGNIRFDSRPGGNSYVGTGNVGIGTTSPEAKLTIKGDALNTNQPVRITNSVTDTHTGLFLNNTGSTVGEKYGMQFGGYNQYSIGGIFGVLDSVSGSTSGDITFDMCNGTSAGSLIERMRITHEGNVGIGVTNPQDFNSEANNLVIGTGSGAEGMTIYGGSSGGSYIYFADGTSGSALHEGFLQYRHSERAMRFGVATGVKMTLEANGNLGIGTTSPGTALQVGGLDDGSNYDITVGWNAISSQAVGTKRSALTFKTSQTGVNNEDIYKWDIAMVTAPATASSEPFGSDLAFLRSTRSSTSVDETTMILTQLGNVGIGTTGPSAELHVKGDSSSGSLPTVKIESTGNISYLKFFNSSTGTGSSDGTYIGMNGGTAYLINKEAGNLYLGTGDAINLTLENGGNVGIGTTNPTNKLHIQGSQATVYSSTDTGGQASAGTTINNTNTSGNTNNFSQLLFTVGTNNNSVSRIVAIRSGSDASDLAFVGKSTAGVAEYMRIKSGGNVGIGINNPSALLEVRKGSISGQIAKFSAINPHVVIESSTAGNAVLHLKPNATSSKSGQFKVTAGNGYNFLWSNDASGTAETAYMDLDTSTTGGGDLTVKGDVIAYGSPSDKKYKENIKPIESALDKAMQLQGVTFDWRDSESILEIKEDIGFIAQDVQKVLPELVRDNGKGNLSLRYQGITPILLEAIKELKAEIEELKLNNCNCNK